MKEGEIINEEIVEEEIKLDPKWGDEDFSRMKEYCVVCGAPLSSSKKRFIASGNYCITCSSECGKNINHKEITIKPNE